MTNQLIIHRLTIDYSLMSLMSLMSSIIYTWVSTLAVSCLQSFLHWNIQQYECLLVLWHFLEYIIIPTNFF